ncbi:MAG: translation initiation factor IF-3 [Candidatus Zixiibacteriota bacterium]|nr:MAG: translation initiation factor IF-3 [candidate division Zixibacteria bacterium]
MVSKDLRINGQIRISPVRLIGPGGDQLGIVPTDQALERAREYGLDLVEVAPNSRPPVCRILDYGKFKYELAKKDKLAKKKQHSFQLKEMRYRPKIDHHDFEFKTKHVREFLEAGAKVKVFVMFRGREMAHTEFGRKILDRVAEELNEISQIEVEPKLEGRTMTMILGPSPELLKKMRDAKLAKLAEDKHKKELTTPDSHEPEEEREEGTTTDAEDENQ